MSTLIDDLTAAINDHSAENGSDTPDYVLADFLRKCLAAYDDAVTARSAWYGSADELGGEISDDGPGTYESVPSRIEAIRWTGHNYAEILTAVPAKTLLVSGELKLLAGADGAQEWVPVPVGHWLVHQPGDLSDVWPVEDAYFRRKYREIRS